MPNGVSDSNDTFSRLRGNDTKPIYSECIKAIRGSYVDKDVFHLERDSTIPSYFMITQCFGNNASDLAVKKCHHPSGNEFEATVPVTSLVTRRIYWNTHCARCNNDGNNIVPWNSTVRFGPRREKTCLKRFANNKGADQPAHPRSLISAFVICFLESTICKLAICEISIFLLFSVAEVTGFGLALSEIPKTGFLATRPI